MMHNELNLLNMKENHKQQQKKNLSFQKKKKGEVNTKWLVSL